MIIADWSVLELTTSQTCYIMTSGDIAASFLKKATISVALTVGLYVTLLGLLMTLTF